MLAYMLTLCQIILLIGVKPRTIAILLCLKVQFHLIKQARLALLNIPFLFTSYKNIHSQVHFLLIVNGMLLVLFDLDIFLCKENQYLRMVQKNKFVQ